MILSRFPKLALLAAMVVVWLPATAQDKYANVPQSVVRKHPKGVQALRDGLFPELENVTMGSQVYEKCGRYQADQLNLCRDAGMAAMDINSGSDVSGVETSRRVTQIREMVGSDATDIYLDCMHSKGLLLHASRTDTSFSGLAGAPWPQVETCATQAKMDADKKREEKSAKIEQEANDRAEHAREEAVEAEEAKRVERERQRAKQLADEACIKTPQHLLFTSSEDVKTALMFVAAANGGVAAVKQLESVSQVVDSQERQAAVANLLDSQARLDSIFADYQKYGGTATSPEAVQPMTDPCHG